MSDPSGPWQPSQAPPRQVAVLASGAPASTRRYLAIQLGALALVMTLIFTSRYWIGPPLLRMVFSLAVLVAPMRWLNTRKVPSAQLRWQPGNGARLSGKFMERHVPVTRPVLAHAVRIDGDRLAFDAPPSSPTGAAEVLSLDCRAFRSVTQRDLHDLFSAALAGDGTTLATVASARGLKPRTRPALIAVSILEAKATHMIALAGTLGLFLAFYLLWHAFPA